MPHLIDVIAVMVTAGGVVSGVMVLAAVRDGSLALRVGLGFWMAAGMLRLAHPRRGARWPARPASSQYDRSSSMACD